MTKPEPKTSSFESSHPDTLAIYCSDGRFTDAVEALVRSLGHPRLDTMTLPGGPGLFELTHSDFAALETVRRAATFLVRGHAIKHVLLVAHEGCGYYRARNLGRGPGQIAAQQIADLRAAAIWFHRTHADVSVALFFAHVVEGRLSFEPIALR
jgi:hypothetical protein